MASETPISKSYVCMRVSSSGGDILKTKRYICNGGKDQYLYTRDKKNQLQMSGFGNGWLSPNETPVRGME